MCLTSDWEAGATQMVANAIYKTGVMLEIFKNDWHGQIPWIVRFHYELCTEAKLLQLQLDLAY